MKYTVLKTKYTQKLSTLEVTTKFKILLGKKHKKSLAKIIFEDIYVNKQDRPWFKPVDSPTLPTPVYT